MKRRAVVTVTFGKEFEQIAKVSHPTIKDYANRCDADFVVIDQRAFRDPINPNWEILRIGSLLNDYERVIYFDTDLIISADAPSLFGYVPLGTFGALNEAKFNSHLQELREDNDVHHIDTRLCANELYFNAGVMVFDRSHEDLFAIPRVFVDKGIGIQTYVNLRLLRSWSSFVDIGIEFNRFPHLPSLRGYLEAYVIHYAGWSHLDRVGMIQRMKDDLWEWLVGNRARLSWFPESSVV